MFNVGEFTKRISFLKLTKTYDKYGESTNEWTVFKSAWAKQFDFIGTDFYASQTTDTKIEVKFNVIYTSGITKEMRILYNNQPYEIIGVPIDVGNLHRELLIYCRLVN